MNKEGDGLNKETLCPCIILFYFHYKYLILYHTVNLSNSTFLKLIICFHIHNHLDYLRLRK